MEREPLLHHGFYFIVHYLNARERSKTINLDELGGYTFTGSRIVQCQH